MSTHLTPEGFRTAAYLEARARLDAKKPKCNPPNRPCRGRCIPPNWKCRAEGEGTDSHSRVVAGDPLAGAAAIARGRTRLAKGLSSGNITDIQAGRAAIARGIVKAVPGKSLKDKQQLRQNVERVILPVATGLFAAWFIRQGHEAAKVMFPVYKRGLANDIENAASTGIGFVFDRVPFLGTYRENVRRNASLQAQLIAQASATYTSSNPDVSSNNRETFVSLSRQKVNGLRTVLSESLDIRKENGEVSKSYLQFRSDVLSNVLGAKQDNKSIYAEPAAIDLVSRQFGINKEELIGSDQTARKTTLISKVSARLTLAGYRMREDMSVRGLDHRNPDDVDKYVRLVSSNTKNRFGSLTSDQADEALSSFGGTIRELVSPEKRGQAARRIANRYYSNAVESYNLYFEQAARFVKEDTSPTMQVVVSAGQNSPLQSTLIGVAERLRNKVGITERIAGANHAELVLQKLYYERAVTGRFNRNRRSTWISSDSDIRYAAQDLGWDGAGGVDAATNYLRNRGFPNLATRPRASAGRNLLPRAQQVSTGTKRPRKNQTRRYTLQQRIEAYIRAGYSQEAAQRQAAIDEAKLKRGDEAELISNHRMATYLLTRSAWI